MSKALQELVREGYFKHPNKRTLENIAKALESKDISTKDKEANIRNSLAGRVKKGILKEARHQVERYSEQSSSTAKKGGIRGSLRRHILSATCPNPIPRSKFAVVI